MRLRLSFIVLSLVSCHCYKCYKQKTNHNSSEVISNIIVNHFIYPLESIWAIQVWTIAQGMTSGPSRQLDTAQPKQARNRPYKSRPKPGKNKLMTVDMNSLIMYPSLYTNNITRGACKVNHISSRDCQVLSHLSQKNVSCNADRIWLDTWQIQRSPLY